MKKYENIAVMSAILQKIRDYDRIVIMRHFRPDGDAVGSTKGLQRILQLSFPEKQILLQNDDFSEKFAFLGQEDARLPDEDLADSLCIILDTATLERVSSKRFSLCREIIKIDHHIEDQPYGSLSWVEDRRSSVCEMIAAFRDAFSDELLIDKEAATYIYTGLVTDSGRFRFNSTSPETLRLAALMLSEGINTDLLFANLYLNDFDSFSVNAEISRSIRITKNGVAYLRLTNADRERLGLTQEKASETLLLMESIKGCLIWLAFIENDDGSTRVRLRSRFVTIKELANRYHGGGHECASGATVYSEAELNALLSDADALLGEYKSTHDGWL